MRPRAPMRWILLWVLAVAAAGCIVVVEDDACYGSIRVAHPISDVSLVFGEAYERDLDDHRAPVFDVPSGRARYSAAARDDVVKVWVGWRGTLHVEPRRRGTTTVRVRARSEGCRDAYVSFVVEVR